MKNGLIITAGIILILFSAFGIYKTITKPKVEEDSLVIKESVNNLQNEIERFNELVGDDVPQKDILHFQQELEKRYSKPEGAVDYLLAGAMIKESTVYNDSFIYETLRRDLFGHPEPDKIKLKREIMDRLTRSGTLERAEYIDVKWTTEKDSVRLITDLYYKDLNNPIRVNILVKQKEAFKQHQEESAGDEEHARTNFYYVSTSAWDIIRAIEKGANSNE